VEVKRVQSSLKHMEHANVKKWSVFDWYKRFRGG